jgi:coenzyme F420 biosynthesis associated uncharacterized protein
VKGVEDLGFIDWDRARKVGGGLVPPGPKLPPDQIAEVVASIKQAAAQADEHVAEVTQLSAGAPAEVLVLDRPRWIAACCATAQVILGTLGAQPSPSGRLDQIKGTTRGVQLGAAFAAVATRILGQFDPFGSPARLLLVAPNVYEVEHELMVDPQDFRLWVCLHEETHRFQFGHAPWLREHILALVQQMLAEDEGGLSWPKPVAGKDKSILDVVFSPQQREDFDRVTAVMSLMEGHADVMMDRVGTQVLPTLPIIRRAFEARRDRRGWASLVGKLLGNDLKLAQYRDGAEFCRGVIDRVAVPGLNAAFANVENLPSMAEIHDPAAWVKRVHG